MKQKMNLKSGMFNGLPAYACALLLLAAGLVLSVLYAVTVGSAELSVGEVYRVILYETRSSSAAERYTILYG